MKKVKVHLISTQTDGNDVNRDVNDYIGTLCDNNGKIVLSYTESQDFGSTVNTTVTVDSPQRVIIERTGSLNSVMIIEKGVSHTNIYPTQYGDILLRFYAKDVKSSLTESGGELFLKYEISADKNSISSNTIDLKFEEMQN